jgi:uncharacterized protein
MYIGMGLMKLGFFTGELSLYVVFGVWMINLTISPLWLRKFAFGPLEWCWRSITYGAVQPMRSETKP